MDFVYKCSECGNEYPVKPDIMRCPDCRKEQEENRPLRGILEVELKGRLPAGSSIAEVLPVEPRFFPDIPVGNTPLWRPKMLAEKIGLSSLFVKDDTRNPTGSYKDRASLLVAAFARKWGIRNITVASTGNAASSMAGIGASAGLQVTIFVPADVPRAKLIQSLQYGARVILVNGSYDDAFRLSMQYQPAGNSLNRNTGYNPLTTEGKKTAAFELYRQMKEVPDYIFVPTGDAVVLSGILKGFKDLHKMGWITKFPRIVAVQAENSDALTRAVEQGGFGEPQTAATLADSIGVDVPANGLYAMQNLQQYGGRCVRVSDEDILQSQKTLASLAGLFVEPASAASLAGVYKLRHEMNPAATVVLMATGSGLKDIDTAGKAVKIPQTPIEKPEDLYD